MQTSSPLKDRCTIYILKCKDGKYYVGRSSEPSVRILAYFSRQGSAWTRRFEPVEVFREYENCTRLDEDKFTKESMAKFGIDNVRGGSYCQMELSEEQHRSLESELRNAFDKCTRCGRDGHFAKDCYARTEVPWQKLGKRESNAAPTTNKRTKSTSQPAENETHCFRCGRTGHWARECGYAEGQESDNQAGEQEEEEEEDFNGCFRCGREGHWINDCFARTTADGRPL